MRTLRVIALAAAMAAASVAVHAATPPVTDAMIDNDAKSAGDVLRMSVDEAVEFFAAVQRADVIDGNIVAAFGFSAIPDSNIFYLQVFHNF